MLPVEGQRRGGGLGGDQRIGDDHALFALDQVHVREVEAAHLVEARRHLEEPVDAEQLRLPPEARVRRSQADGPRAGPATPSPRRPRRPSVGSIRIGSIVPTKAAAGIREVLSVGERQLALERPVLLPHRLRDRAWLVQHLIPRSGSPTGGSLSESIPAPAAGLTPGPRPQGTAVRGLERRRVPAQSSPRPTSFGSASRRTPNAASTPSRISRASPMSSSVEASPRLIRASVCLLDTPARPWP